MLPDPKDIVSGDRVQSEVDMELLGALEGRPELAGHLELVSEASACVGM